MNSEFSRRSMMVAGAGLAAAVGIGASSAIAGEVSTVDRLQAASIVNHPLMRNVVRAAKEVYPSAIDGSMTALTLMLNAHLIGRHGHELFPDPSLYMGAPVSLVVGREDETVEARTRKLDLKWTFAATDPNLTGEMAVKAKAEILDAAVDAVRSEMLAESKTCRDAGKRIHPFVPLIAKGILIDPVTYNPVIAFLTRYGVSDA